MLGPRRRFADQRAPRAEQLEPNENGNDDGRESKRSKNGERAPAPPEAPASAAETLALTATNLYAIAITKAFISVASVAMLQLTSAIFIPKRLIHSRISVVTMAGAAIAIDDASAADSILSVKRRVFAANRAMYVRRQRLVYTAGPRGMEPLADNETLGGAGVAQDGSAKLDVLLADLTREEAAKLCSQVRPL